MLLTQDKDQDNAGDGAPWHAGPRQLSCDLKGGGGEGLADAGDKTMEQLYSEAKEILALQVESPCNTGPRRPPR